MITKGFKINLRFPNSGSKSRERGNTLVMAAVMLPVMLGAAGLVLDWGRGVWTRSELQKAADAGALAGASALPSVFNAGVRSSNIVNANYQNPDSAHYTVSNNNEYTVALSDNIPVFFMRIFGHTSMEIGVTATAAGERVVGGLNGGGFPFAIINPNLNADPADDLTQWNYGDPYIIGYGEDNVMVQDWANGSAAPPSNPGGNGKGIGGNNNSNGWRAGLGLCFDGTYGNAGGNDIKNDMIYGWPGEMRIGDDVPTSTGNMTGPITQGRDGLLGNNPLPWEGFDPDTDYKESRVILVPIVHLKHATRGDTYTIQDFNNGANWDKQEVVVDGFAPFFLLKQSESNPYIPNSGNANDWIVGFFIPGTRTGKFLSSGGSAPEFGLYTHARLID